MRHGQRIFPAGNDLKGFSPHGAALCAVSQRDIRAHLVFAVPVQIDHESAVVLGIFVGPGNIFLIPEPDIGGFPQSLLPERKGHFDPESTGIQVFIHLFGTDPPGDIFESRTRFPGIKIFPMGTGKNRGLIFLGFHSIFSAKGMERTFGKIPFCNEFFPGGKNGAYPQQQCCQYRTQLHFNTST